MSPLINEEFLSKIEPRSDVSEMKNVTQEGSGNAAL